MGQKVFSKGIFASPSSSPVLAPMDSSKAGGQKSPAAIKLNFDDNENKDCSKSSFVSTVETKAVSSSTVSVASGSVFGSSSTAPVAVAASTGSATSVFGSSKAVTTTSASSVFGSNPPP